MESISALPFDERSGDTIDVVRQLLYNDYRTVLGSYKFRE